MPHFWLMQRLLWALSVMFGSLAIFLLYFILIGRLSLVVSAYVVIFLGAALVIVGSLPHLKDKGGRPG